jgi:hypothetical protein
MGRSIPLPQSNKSAGGEMLAAIIIIVIYAISVVTAWVLGYDNAKEEYSYDATEKSLKLMDIYENHLAHKDERIHQLMETIRYMKSPWHTFIVGNKNTYPSPGDYIILLKPGYAAVDEYINGNWYMNDPQDVVAWMPVPEHKNMLEAQEEQ